MDASQWPQVGLQVRPMEEIGTTPNNSATMNQRAPPQVVGERRARPQKDQNLNCPRCNSTNTKFCYYNNYSLTQPRYFCKTCRRYWTQGGSLRNVPVGGGSRKNKRSTQPTALSSSSPMINIPSSSTPASTNLIPDLNPPVTCSLTQLITSSQNPKLIHEGQDLNLSFPIHGQDYHGIFQPIGLPKIESENNNNNNNSVTSCSTSSTATITNNSTPPISALELLRSGMASRGVLNSYVPIPMPDSNALYPSGFHNLQEFKPNLGSFGGDANIGGPRFSVGGVHEQESNINGGGARLLFPFADMNKLASATTNEANAPNEVDDQMNGKEQHDHHHQHQHHHHHHHQGSSGYWNGMLGGGTW